MANNKIRKYANAGRVKGGKGIAAAGLFDRLSNDAAMLRNQRMGTKFQDLGPKSADIIKAENGNWTGGERINSVDRNIMLMNKSMDDGRSFESELKVLNRINEPELRALHTARQNEETDQRIREATQSIALNKWINGNLKNYIKKQMATPSDPVRLMMDKRADEIRAAYLEDRKKGQDMLNRASQLDDPRKKANLEREAKKLLKDATEHRELALQNIGHMTPDEMRQHMSTMDTSDDPLIALQEKRAKEGFPTTRVSRNKSAQAWEQLTDTAIVPTTKQELLNSAEENKKFMATAKAIKDLEAEMHEQAIQKVAENGVPLDQARRYVSKESSYDQAKYLGRNEEYDNLRNEFYKGHHKNLYEYEPDVETLQANPFIEKLDPEQKLYNIHKYYSGNDIFGMDKVVDALKKDLAAGKIRPEQLNKLTVDQAIERVGRQKLKAAQEAKEARLKSMADMPVYKEYPEEGFKFVQLTKPGQFAQESDVMGHSVRGYEPPRDHPEFIPEAEGGHRDYGLGGYEAIKSGKAKIYSLRDEAGNSHATIEVKAPKNLHIKEYLESLPEDEIIKLKEGVAKEGLNPESSYALMRYVEEHSPEYQAANKEYKTTYAPDIIQIKGKHNDEVHPDYLKYVQDFVQSGKFNEVNDLHNADLRSVSGIDPSVVKKLGLKIPKYLNEQQIRELNEAIYNYRPEMGEPHLIPLPESIQKFRTPPEEGMKQGGPVAKSHHYHKIARDFGLPHLSEGGELKDDEESKIDDMIQTMHANVADLHEKLPNYAQSNVRSSAHPALASMPHSPDNEGPRPFMSGRGNQDFGHYRAGVEVPIGPVNLRASAGSHFGRNLDTAGNLRHIGLDAPLLGGRLHFDATRDPKIGHKEYKVAYERHFKDGSEGGVHYQDPLGVPDSGGVTEDTYKNMQGMKEELGDLKDAAVNAYYKDKRHLVTPEGKKNYALQMAALYAGTPVDMVNMGLQGVDLAQGLAGRVLPDTFMKPASVLNPNGERVLAHPIAFDKPRGGSADLLERLNHDYEFYSPALAMTLGPLAAAKAYRGARYGVNKALTDRAATYTPAYSTIESTAPDLGQGTSTAFREGMNERLLESPLRSGSVDMRTVAGQPTSMRKGQGTYTNEAKQLELNPMNVYRHPNVGAINEGGNPEFRKHMAQVGVDLNQEAMAAHRFMPLPIQNSHDATSLLIKAKGQSDLTPEQIEKIASKVPNLAISHNPELGGLVMFPFEKAQRPFTGRTFEKAIKQVEQVLGKETQPIFGRSNYGRDRMYMLKNQGDYAKAGAGPMNPATKALRDELNYMGKNVFPPDRGTAVSGGLQPWSRGPDYPTHVQGIGNGDLVEHRPVNYATDEIGPKYSTYEQANQHRKKMLSDWHRSLPNKLD